MKRTITALLTAVTLSMAVGYAQQPQIWRGGYGNFEPPKLATKDTFKGAFNHCRLMFDSNRREKSGWRTDYPGADINFSVRLAELTKTRVDIPPTGDPEYVVVRATDDALFQCGYVLVEDGGTAFFSDAEVTRLRTYLLKGGFIFSSDYWGPLAQAQFDEQIGRALPPSQYPVIDLPLGSSIWHMQFNLTRFPQMSSIQSWRRTGGGHTERGITDPPHVRGIADEHGRLMVVEFHNSDIPDGWEREGEEHEYFFTYSPEAYSVGVDVLLYAMTH